MHLHDFGRTYRKTETQDQIRGAEGKFRTQDSEGGPTTHHPGLSGKIQDPQGGTKEDNFVVALHSKADISGIR